MKKLQSSAMPFLILIIILVHYSLGHYAVGKRGRLVDEQIDKNDLVQRLATRAAYKFDKQELKNVNEKLDGIRRELARIATLRGRVMEKEFKRLPENYDTDEYSRDFGKRIDERNGQ